MTGQAILTEQELLSSLREAASRRVVAYAWDGEEQYPAVIECAEGAPDFETGELVAWINPDSEAAQLLFRALDARCENNLEVFSALPVRYGPFCSTWVLPSHPLAPQTVKQDDELPAQQRRYYG